MATAGLAAPSAAEVIGLSEDHVWAFVIELAGLGDGSDAGFGLWRLRGHASIFADEGTYAGFWLIPGTIATVKIEE
jgi:hypothetical protein